MLRRLARGVVAGAVGTAAMTAVQEAVSRARGSAGGKAESWDEAPGPAQVANKLVRAVTGRELPVEQISLTTNVVHWLYGTAMGVPYAVLRVPGPVYGLVVWAWSYVQLVPLGIYEPPWRYSAKELAPDLGYHLAYGTGVATAYEALERL